MDPTIADVRLEIQSDPSFMRAIAAVSKTWAWRQGCTEAVATEQLLRVCARRCWEEQMLMIHGDGAPPFMFGVLESTAP
jgi:hypothetical protein